MTDQCRAYVVVVLESAGTATRPTAVRAVFGDALNAIGWVRSEYPDLVVPAGRVQQLDQGVVYIGEQGGTRHVTVVGETLQ